MKNKIIIVLLIIPLIISIASACSCIYLPDAQSKFDNAAYVFTGKVIELKKSGDYLEKMQEASMKINQYWKPSDFQESVNIKLYATEDSGANCGYNFEEEKEYLIYAYLDIETGKLETNSCMGNSFLEDAQNEIQDLNQITNPVIIENNDNEYQNNIFSRLISWIKNIFS